MFLQRNIFVPRFIRFIEELLQYLEPQNYCRKSNFLGVRKVLQEYFPVGAGQQIRAKACCIGTSMYIEICILMYLSPKPWAGYEM